MAVKEAARSCAGGEGGQWDHVREGRSRAKCVWKRRGRERESARVCERLRERELPLGAVVKLMEIVVQPQESGTWGASE